MLDSILESLHVVSLPTKTDFRSVTDREVALFEGPCGWGEFAPFLEYGAQECVPWLVSGIESAFVPFPVARNEYIRVNATLPAVNGADRIREVLSWFPGCDTIKIKVGSNLEEDILRISTAREIVPGAKIRIDVNGNWGVNEAVTALRSIIDRTGEIEYVEQPCATVEELRQVKSKFGNSLTITGDEVIRKAANPLTVDLRGAIDVVMLKVAPLGGIAQSLAIASHHGLPTVVSSALDSAVGISTGLHLAATFESQTFAAGLGTGSLLTADIARLPIIDGRIKVERVTPSSLALAKYDVDSARYDFWRARISQTWQAGANDWVAKKGWVA
jgi:O-succinylbenzoate synthase